VVQSADMISLIAIAMHAQVSLNVLKFSPIAQNSPSKAKDRLWLGGPTSGARKGLQGRSD
jgi:hypothetical protein